MVAPEKPMKRIELPGNKHIQVLTCVEARMKRLFAPVVLAAALSGCAVVAPYERPYSDLPTTSYNYPDSVPPGYLAPSYHPPVYVLPPVRLGFRLHFWSGRGHRHHHGFGGHRFGGWRGGWKH